MQAVLRLHRTFITGPSVPGNGGSLPGVKKLILVLAAAGAGFAVYKKRAASKPQQTLWAQATDRV